MTTDQTGRGAYEASADEVDRQAHEVLAYRLWPWSGRMVQALRAAGLLVSEPKTEAGRG